MIKEKAKPNKATVKPWFTNDNFISKRMVINWPSMTVFIDNKKGDDRK